MAYDALARSPDFTRLVVDICIQFVTTLIRFECHISMENVACSVLWVMHNLFPLNNSKNEKETRENPVKKT